MSASCAYCAGPASREVAVVAALLQAIARDDVDAAIELGLLRFEADGELPSPCARCSAAIDRLLAVRDARRDALAARERYRTRNARLARRVQERAARRAAPAPAMDGTTKAALPSAAAAALARAKAKAAGRA